jgi:hypothetical protein
MEAAQWIIAAVTAIFVASVAFLQWRTAQQKAVLDLFERRRAIYDIVRSAVSRMTGSSAGFDQAREIEFGEMVESAYFFFGDDIEKYLKQMLSDIIDVRTADTELGRDGPPDPETRRKMLDKRRAAWDRIQQFHTTGRALFARYMRFSQTVPTTNWCGSRGAD